MKIIKFGAEWCPACKALQPILESLIPSNPNHNFIFKDVDTDEGSAAALFHKVKSLPTTLILNDKDEELFRFVGSKNKELIQSFIDDLS